MPDLDLAAIRADLAAVRNPGHGQPLVATRPLPLFAVNALDRLTGTHLPALLAEVDRLTADRTALASEVRRLADRLREVTAEREEWREKAIALLAAGRLRRVVGGDCPEPGCVGERFEFERYGAGPIVRSDCGHEPPPDDDADPPAGKAAVRPPDGSDPASCIDALGP